MKNNEFGLSTLTNTLENAITGVPTPIRKNLFKAIEQLCTAAVDVPIAHLESIAAEKRATSEARIQIIKKGGDSISEQINVPQEYVSIASKKYAAKIIKEQVNLDDITHKAVNELTNSNLLENNNSEPEEISEDWLNEFENLARFKSSEDMKLIFGKILSGEITRPGSFSIKTVKLISQLDNQAARLFQLLCSQAVSLQIGDLIHDARVISFNGNAASNALSQFGLPFDSLNILQEYGLIISDYNSYMPYATCIVNEQNQIGIALRFQNKNYGLVPTDREKFDKILQLRGVALTKAGKELLNIIPMDNAEDYKRAMIEFFKSKYLDLQEIPVG